MSEFVPSEENFIPSVSVVTILIFTCPKSQFSVPISVFQVKILELGQNFSS